MRKIESSIISCVFGAVPILFCLNLCIGNLCSQTSEHTAEKTQVVVIIGTIHSAHYENSNYSPEKLKGIILSLKPDAILNELPLSLVDPNGRPLERIRRKGNPGGPESWAADTVAQQLGIKQNKFRLIGLTGRKISARLSILKKRKKPKSCERNAANVWCKMNQTQ
jgi:hypothetical protein